VNNTPTDDQLTEFQRLFTNAGIRNWATLDFMSFNWWLLGLILVVPWIIWYKLVNKKRILEILLFGLIVSTILSFIDGIGTSFTLWTYPTKFLPVLPRLVPLDFSLYTVLYMLVYQYATSWKPYIIANLILCGIYAFFGMPLFILMGIYKLLNWHLFYSYLAFIGVALLSKWVMNLLLSKQSNAMA
jgi:hypothetical protein